MLYVHCIDQKTKFQLTIAGFPILKVNYVYGHVSLLKDLPEQRLVAGLVAFRTARCCWRNSAILRSPCCVYIKSIAVSMQVFLTRNATCHKQGYICFRFFSDVDFMLCYSLHAKYKLNMLFVSHRKEERGREGGLCES